MIKIRIGYTVLLATVLLLAGCAGSVVTRTPTAAASPSPTTSQETPVVETKLVRSSADRDMRPDLPQEELTRVVSGNNAFALDLYKVVRQEGQNLFYSPYSIWIALAMTYAGAEGETAQQMAETLHFPDQDVLHPGLNALDLAFARQAEALEGDRTDGFRLNVANAVWAQQGYDFLEAYLHVLATHYDAGVRLVDFQGAAEAARQAVNDWVAEETEGRIEELIPRGAVDELTRLVLTNAIYFNATWLLPFQEEETEDRPFFPLGGEELSVPTMRQIGQFSYAEFDGHQAVELRYLGELVSMLAILPADGAFETFEEELSADQVEEIVGRLERSQLDLSLPKFEFDSALQLSQALADMGMADAFSPGEADFSGMDGTQDLYIQEVLHKAFVRVDEKGTEAAAATGVVVGITSAPPEPVVVRMDRPFIFLIRDMETGTILFAGRVLDPS